jgi:hypothetical protein
MNTVTRAAARFQRLFSATLPEHGRVDRHTRRLDLGESETARNGETISSQPDIGAPRNIKYTTPHRQSAAKRKSVRTGYCIFKIENGTNAESVMTSCRSFHCGCVVGPTPKQMAGDW